MIVKAEFNNFSSPWQESHFSMQAGTSTGNHSSLSKRRFTRSQLAPEPLMYLDVSRLLDIDLPPRESSSNSFSTASHSAGLADMVNLDWSSKVLENNSSTWNDHLYTKDYKGMIYDLAPADIDDLPYVSRNCPQIISTSGNSSKPVVYIGPAGDLPEGWTMKQLMRKSGVNKGKFDTYWYTPVLKKQLRSKVQVRKFIEKMKLQGDEEAVYKQLVK